MTTFATNIVTHFPSKTLGTLFRNPKSLNDPNIYVIFSGHVVNSDEINATFLTFDNLTLNAKILNVNVWVDVAVAVIQNPTYVDFPITTNFLIEPVFEENQDVIYYSNYQINNSLARPITSNIRDPFYRYPQMTNHFFYPESFLLREAQGVKGISGSPVVDTEYNVIGISSKIFGQKKTNDSCDCSDNTGDNLVVVKFDMIYLYLFGEKYGLITNFFEAYNVDPNINNNFNILNDFRNSFNIVLCHIGFSFLSYKEWVSQNNLNLSKNVTGSVLATRVTGINEDSYQLIDYIQKNDPNIYYYRTLFEGSEIMNDYYKNKSKILVRALIFIDRLGNERRLDLGTDSFAPYYVNGDPSKPLKVEYLIYGPAGEDGVNMVFGPLKTVTVTPFLVPDSQEGTERWTSQLPRVLTSTTVRANFVIQKSLYNNLINGGPYLLRYAGAGITTQMINAQNSTYNSSSPSQAYNQSGLNSSIF